MQQIILPDLEQKEFSSYYGTYINKVVHKDIVKGLEVGKTDFIDFVQSIPEEKLTYAYAKDKWTLAEVFVHIIDTERIFAYRALRFARNDKTPITGFEQNDYVPYSNANTYSKEDIIFDFEAVRNSSISLFNRFTGDMLGRIGEASGDPMSARAAGYIMSGHQIHHFQVIKERYF
ncbi:DinB family protein [Aquimarina aquimarini]|uniref:DinB family protein n=1 Tax=Aquimarina aquimarini TaxID=1191734 RepID=UPI000D55FEA9|nr:DinB family protein [Aquimarina aquimarini]